MSIDDIVSLDNACCNYDYEYCSKQLKMAEHTIMNSLISSTHIEGEYQKSIMVYIHEILMIQ